MDRKGEACAINSNFHSEVEEVVSRTALSQRIRTVRLSSLCSLARTWMKGSSRNARADVDKRENNYEYSRSCTRKCAELQAKPIN